MNKPFKPNRKFWKDYRGLRKDDPIAANMLLFLCEKADQSGTVKMSDDDMLLALNLRFPDPEINSEIEYKKRLT